ncbi:fused serine/threonine kinase-like protein, partial [Obelidium mucronatum]
MVTQDDPQISAYSIGECIGTGQYGKVSFFCLFSFYFFIQRVISTRIPLLLQQTIKVFRAVYKRTNTLVALKLVDLSCRSKQDVEALRDEIICHQKMSRHPNIVYCLDSFVTRKEVAVVTELCPNGDLMAALQSFGEFSLERVQEFGVCLVQGLQFLHVECGIVHRDLKLQNILISSTGTLKICDFGFAQLLRGSLENKLTLTSVKGTPIYMAPELIQEEPYTHLVDLWALGIMLFELRTGKPPFYTTNIFKLMEMILKDPVVFPDKVSAETEFKDLVSNLLMKQPSARLDWPNLAMHPFI